jgi:hypothetical protein
MCHFLLLLPVLALPAFWIWPVETALPVYGTAVAVALAVYVLAYKARKMPLANGPQALLGATGRVICVGERMQRLPYRCREHDFGELALIATQLVRAEPRPVD